MTPNVFGGRGGTIKGKENGCLELGLGALDLSFGDIVREAGPFAKSEVNKIVDASELVSDKVDTPETSFVSNNSCKR